MIPIEAHNHWKLKQLQRIFISAAIWAFGLIALVADLFFNCSLSFDLISSIVSVLSILFGVFFTLLENVLWKTKLMNLPLLEDYWTPCLEGRWEGILTRDGEPHDFVIEICQGFTCISCCTYSRHSKSSALTAEMLYDKQNKRYQLAFYWNGSTTTTQENTGAYNQFDGFTVLDVVLEGRRVIGLDGKYFTDRQPKQTLGFIKLEKHQKNLKKAF